MRKLVLAFPLLMLALIAIAIYVQTSTSSLSLPIATGTTVLTILLPLFTTAVVFYTPVLIRLAGSSPTRQLLLPALHILHGALAIIIATLSAQGFASEGIIKCGLEGNWQQLWHTHDGRAIERIQNTFECCGFHSIVDRAWPPKGHCSDMYNRHTSCDEPWRASYMRTSGLQFAVAVVVGLVQMAHLAYLRQRSVRADRAQDFRRISRQVSAGESERLIENGIEHYEDHDEAENGAERGAARSALPRSGGNNAHHRVEVSGLGREESNEWAS